MTKEYLINTINYKNDIEPYQFIEIHAGLGAGKNTLIGAFAQGKIPDAPKMNVLLITSRRAKVDETISFYENPDQRNLNTFHEHIGRAWSETDEAGNRLIAPIGSVVCTSAFVAAYLKNVYNPEDPTTHLWELFDLIAIDEAHSILVDAGYQDAPFHVYNLINYFLDRCIRKDIQRPVCKHIVLMTGTPDPLNNYFVEDGIKSAVLNRMEQCVNVQPRNVRFIESSEVTGLLMKLLEEKKRCIYFCNRIERIQTIYQESGLPKEQMAISFSNVEKRKKLESDDKVTFENMVRTEDSIKANFRIPDPFLLFLTTTRYREGINICDPIDCMIVETHNRSDAVQMAGRVRAGVNDLYIVTDAATYPIDYEKESLELKLANIQIYGCSDPTEERLITPEGEIDKHCYPLNYMLNEVSDEELKKFIELVEEKFPYIKYSYLYHCFMPYDVKVSGLRYIRQENEVWLTAEKNHQLEELVSEWFPEASVQPYESTRDEKYKASWAAWRKRNLKLDVIYSKEEKNEFQKELTTIWGYKNMNTLLKQFSSYVCKRAGKGNKGFKFSQKTTS